MFLPFARYTLSKLYCQNSVKLYLSIVNVGSELLRKPRKLCVCKPCQGKAPQRFGREMQREIWAWTLLVCAVCAVEFACHIWFLPLRCAHRVTLQQLSPSSQCCPGHMSVLIYIYYYIYIII